VINYRSQGLANKNTETQPIVLAKRSKARVSSEKSLGMDLGVKIRKVLGVTCKI
jgi:hypothetical protein